RHAHPVVFTMGGVTISSKGLPIRVGFLPLVHQPGPKLCEIACLGFRSQLLPRDKVIVGTVHPRPPYVSALLHVLFLFHFTFIFTSSSSSARGTLISPSAKSTVPTRHAEASCEGRPSEASISPCTVLIPSSRYARARSPGRKRLISSMALSSGSHKGQKRQLAHSLTRRGWVGRFAGSTAAKAASKAGW